MEGNTNGGGEMSSKFSEIHDLALYRDLQIYAPQASGMVPVYFRNCPLQGRGKNISDFDQVAKTQLQKLQFLSAAFKPWGEFAEPCAVN